MDCNIPSSFGGKQIHYDVPLVEKVNVKKSKSNMNTANAASKQEMGDGNQKEGTSNVFNTSFITVKLEPTETADCQNENLPADVQPITNTIVKHEFPEIQVKVDMQDMGHTEDGIKIENCDSLEITSQELKEHESCAVVSGTGNRKGHSALPVTENNSDVSKHTKAKNISAQINCKPKQTINESKKKLYAQPKPESNVSLVKNQTLNEIPTSNSADSQTFVSKRIQIPLRPTYPNDPNDLKTDVIELVIKKEIEPKAPNDLEKFACDFCSYVTNRQKFLETHSLLHTKDDIKSIFPCPHCDYLTKNESHLLCHIKTHTGEKPFSCDLCQYKCVTRSHLVNHMRTHTGEKPYSCTYCPYKSITKGHLDRHITTHTGDKPFACSYCDYKCSQRYILNSHTKIHTGTKPFPCSVCDYRGLRKVHLTRHMKTHTGEKPFTCDICQYRCSTKTRLGRHITTHVGKKSFSCNLCDYKCVSRSYLASHHRTHTKQRLYTCKFCQFKCYQETLLADHVKMHAGEKRFSCNLCDYKCMLRRSLRDHMRTHTGEKPFVCDICHTKFRFRSNLFAHKKIHVSNI